MFDTQAASRTSNRSVVVQRRSIQRVQDILDAAQGLLSEHGYEAATLKAIGERAGIPTASLYHYFPDRHQVDAALMQRHLSELDALISAAVQGSAVRTLRDAVDAVLDPYLAYMRTHPDFIQLWFVARTPALNELAAEFDTSQARRIWKFFLAKKLIRRNTPELVGQLAFEAGNRLLDVAFRHDVDGDDAVLQETRRMLYAYLQTYAPATRQRPK